MLPFDKFDNLAKLDRMRSPLLVIHRRDDHVIPFWHGQALYRAAREPKQCLWTEHGGHEAIYRNDDPAYRSRLAAFCASIEDLPRPNRK